MKPNRTLLKTAVAAMFMVTAVLLIHSNGIAANRIFPMHLKNGTTQPVTFTIVMGSCYQGTGYYPPKKLKHGPVPPGGKATITLARVQGHGCDGKQGYFMINPSGHGGESQHFNFNNGGGLAVSNIVNRYDGVLSAKSAVDESYTWTFRETGKRLSGPLNERLTKPKNRVATDSGAWGATSRVERFSMLNQSQLGLWGNFYDDCAGKELYHPQHVVRLANKNGRAYFMVSQSRAHNGWITLLETAPGALNPATDLIVSRGSNAPAGKYIWQDLYRRKGQIPNPVGNWNHPGKMAVVDGVLIVAAQNWDATFICTSAARGATIDKVLFYDVRDPQHPRYWGAMDAKELGVKEISTVGLMKTPNNDYLLTAGGDGTYATYTAREISPNITDWTRGAGTFSGQHGMEFNSYQKTTRISGSALPKGVERLMYFDSSGENDAVTFSEYDYNPATRRLKAIGSKSYSVNLPGANRHWDADSLYVSQFGAPIIYSMESTPGQNGILLQVHNPRNRPVLITMAMVLGEYRLSPYQNDWHIGWIENDGAGGLRWRNKAGAKWRVTPDFANKRLKAEGNDNPYASKGLREFKLVFDNRGKYQGFEFPPGQKYHKQ